MRLLVRVNDCMGFLFYFFRDAARTLLARVCKSAGGAWDSVESGVWALVRKKVPDDE